MILFEISREAFLPFLVFSFLSGVILCALYDVLRIRRMATRRAGKHRLDLVLTFFEDVIFCLLSTVTMILVTYKLYYGIPRWYSYGACALGFLTWRKTASRLVMKLSDKIIGCITAALSAVNRKLVRPAFAKTKRLIKKTTAKIRLKNKSPLPSPQGKVSTEG